MPDIARWAAVAAGFVKPGGFFYLAEGHPIHVAFDPARFARTSYFDSGPRRFLDERSYTDGDGTIARPANYRWAHTLGDVVTAIAQAGLRIEFLHEHPHVAPNDHLPASAPGLFSVRASKPLPG